MTTPAASTMRRDIVSAYLATAAKVGSWALITAAVYRFSRPEFALLALVRATLGLLNYTAIGLAPAMIRLLAEAKTRASAEMPVELQPSRILAYRSAPPADPSRDVYSNGLVVAFVTALVASLLVLAYAGAFSHLHELPQQVSLREAQWVVIWMGLGTVLRLMSDSSGAVLQTRGMIALDNRCLIAADLSWIIWTIVFSALDWGSFGFVARADQAAMGYAASGLMFWASRFRLAAQYTGIVLPQWDSLHFRIVQRLLTFGALVALAQLADFLYAPVDYILINQLINPITVATYAPAVQIDSALLMLMSGLATVLLPRAAVAHAADDRTTLRRYYVRGTLAGAAVLLLVAIGVWLIAPRLLRLWLGIHSAHADTLAILPLVLMHTVIGGSSAVGRSILLGMGKVKPFAAAALISGIGNVILSIIFVKAGFGLRGIIYGTIIAVVGRCAIWMPWYVLRTIRIRGNDELFERAASPGQTG